MAAKVAMVAVPTVLGIASIRVYRTNEEPVDGLVPRSKLNIYTPLPDSAQATFVPESPGVIERGVSVTRQSIVPLVQAVKDACVYVKKGSVNIYHGGEDVYYYLIEPPPEFLPRFGTITMAGLLGMFLARKGSRFKRLAVPLGLMSAAASVCYPAQAVAALKVTGKKVYAAGRWSGAVASSLLASKKPVSTEILASQPQAATEPNPESAQDASLQSPVITESDMSAPASYEPVVAVTTEEDSSGTLTEISTHQPPTEPSSGLPPCAGSFGDSLPGETLISPPSDESASPARSEEELNEKQAFDDDSAESTAYTQTEATEEVPVESSSEISADVESRPPPSGTSDPETSDAPSDPAGDSTEPVIESEPQQSSTQQPATESSKEGSGFKPDPALMDFGQSSPEDEDLYSTRS
ncbi:MICOS complex subunit Mic27 isoform X1 [Oryzias latipes]|uniref:MICOS complex subunit Mic27 isoform X1 n=1 Tax=Oryzias latipes TaxID=8090 RepID=UPI0005CC800A|nr:MICOS complex subunit Mic27 isoform X1 [Oryzias latipes]